MTDSTRSDSTRSDSIGEAELLAPLAATGDAQLAQLHRRLEREGADAAVGREGAAAGTETPSYRRPWAGPRPPPTEVLGP